MILVVLFASICAIRWNITSFEANPGFFLYLVSRKNNNIDTYALHHPCSFWHFEDIFIICSEMIFLTSATTLAASIILEWNSTDDCAKTGREIDKKLVKMMRSETSEIRWFQLCLIKLNEDLKTKVLGVI